MEKRIELERRARKANQITELNLDNCRSTSIVGLTDEYTALETLSLINVGLTTLKGFPNLPNLKKLELSDNRISNGLNYLHTSPKLQFLNLSGNKIKDLETLKPLEQFKHLAILDLFNNEATHVKDYREKMFEMLPSLTFLDGYDRNDVESPEEEEQYSSEGNANAFCINGLEFNLDELAAFKQQLEAKRKAATTRIGDQATQVPPNQNRESTVDAAIDDLDEYLKELKLKAEKEEEKSSSASSQLNSIECNPFKSTTQTSTATITTATTPMNFALLLYWFLAVLNMAKIVFQCEDEEDEDDSGPSADEDDNNVDVSLSEVYNDDLEEDEDEWDEANNDEDDEDEESDEDELNESSVTTAEQQKTEKKESAGVEETHARGKKRKHEG